MIAVDLSTFVVVRQSTSSSFYGRDANVIHSPRAAVHAQFGSDKDTVRTERPRFNSDAAEVKL